MASKGVASVGGSNTGGDGSPPVTRDPRFKAGRTLVQTGRATEGAVNMFATLLEVRTKGRQRRGASLLVDETDRMDAGLFVGM